MILDQGRSEPVEIANLQDPITITFPRLDRPQAADESLPVTLWAENPTTCDWWSLLDEEWTNSEVGQYCNLSTTYYELVDDFDLQGNTTCLCNHLTSFATIQALYPGDVTTKSIDLDIWWYVILAFAVTTFVCISMWMVVVVRRWKRRMKEDERFFPEPPKPVEMDLYGKEEMVADGQYEGEEGDWDEEDWEGYEGEEGDGGEGGEGEEYYEE